MIGRDVGGIDRADRRREGQAPGERLSAGGCVAGATVAEQGDIFAVPHVRLPLREQRGDSRIGDMQGDGKEGRSGHDEHQGCDHPKAARETGPVHSRTIGPGSFRYVERIFAAAQ